MDIFDASMYLAGKVAIVSRGAMRQAIDPNGHPCCRALCGLVKPDQIELDSVELLALQDFIKCSSQVP